MTTQLGEAGVPVAPAKDNPAATPEKKMPARERIPMSVPLQKLSVPEIPGYHSHWMKGDVVRINQALRAGYTFVDQDEVDMNTVGLADGIDTSGHTDLGSRVSIMSGRGEDGKGERLYLMKLPIELWEEDQRTLAHRQEGIAATLRGDEGFSKPGMDVSNRYGKGLVEEHVKAKKEPPNMFQPKRST